MGRYYVKLDRDALAAARREYGLSAVDVAVIVLIVCEADFRSRRWEGSYRGLSETSGASPNTIPKAVKRLRGAGLVTEVEPFSHGGPGVLCVCSYWRFVVPEDKTPREALAPCDHAQNCATDDGDRRADLREQSRSGRADLRGSRAVVPQNRASPLAGQSDSGSQEERLSEEGASQERDFVSVLPREIVVMDGREREVF